MSPPYCGVRLYGGWPFICMLKTAEEVDSREGIYCKRCGHVHRRCSLASSASSLAFKVADSYGPSGQYTFFVRVDAGAVAPDGKNIEDAAELVLSDAKHVHRFPDAIGAATLTGQQIQERITCALEPSGQGQRPRRSSPLVHTMRRSCHRRRSRPRWHQTPQLLPWRSPASEWVTLSNSPDRH